MSLRDLPAEPVSAVLLRLGGGAPAAAYQGMGVNSGRRSSEYACAGLASVGDGMMAAKGVVRGSEENSNEASSYGSREDARGEPRCANHYTVPDNHRSAAL